MTRSIEIYTRTADTATIDGRLIHRGYFPTIYDAAIAEAQSIALDQGRSVLIKAIDGVGDTGTTWIELHQDGKLEPAQAPEDETAETPSGQRRRRRAAEEPDQEDDESDFYSPVSPPAHVDVAQDQPPALRALPQDSPRPSDVPSWALPAQGSPAQPGEHLVPGMLPALSESPAAAAEPMQDHPQLPRQEPRTGPIALGDRPQQQFSIPPSREPYAPPPQPGSTGWQQPQPPHGGHHQAPQHAAPWIPQHPMAGPQAPPSLADLRASRPDAPESPATTGWRGGFNRSTGGLFKLAPSEEELRLRRARDAVQRSLRGPRTVVVINTKGGGGKTTAVYSLAATFGQARGGYVLGWDNNETRGTLAWRSAPARHTNTAVDLLRDLERFEDPRNARVGDLDNYVRAQGSAQFDVLASDENAASAASIDDAAFRALHRSLSRFYRILVIDTGNNVKAPNWGAAVDLADQLVVVSSVREDTAGGASWTLDHLTEIGLGEKVRNAVTILSAPKAAADPDQRAMQARFREHFAARTRTVLDVPFDPALVDGDSIVFEALSPATRQAWLIAAAAIAEGL